MTWNKIGLVAFAVLALWKAGHDFRLRPVHPPDGLLAPDEPQQQSNVDAAAIAHGRWTLTPRATYDITARILGRESYWLDSLSDLVPEDLALGWGPMSDNRILQDFKIEQSGRFYYWRPVAELPITRQEVISHSANTHVIPASSAVRSQLASLRVGQVVRLTGLLVDAQRADGLSIRTSLTREDSGAGACEVMLVQRVVIE